MIFEKTVENDEEQAMDEARFIRGIKRYWVSKGAFFTVFSL